MNQKLAKPIFLFCLITLCNHFVIFSYDSSPISRNVGLSVCRSVGLPATSFIEVLCCCQCMNVVTVVVVYDIRTFCCHILHFKLRQQLLKSQCQIVKSFIQAIMLLLVYVRCCNQCNCRFVVLSFNCQYKGCQLKQYKQQQSLE